MVMWLWMRKHTRPRPNRRSNVVSIIVSSAPNAPSGLEPDNVTQSSISMSWAPAKGMSASTLGAGQNRDPRNPSDSTRSLVLSFESSTTFDDVIQESGLVYPNLCLLYDHKVYEWCRIKVCRIYWWGVKWAFVLDSSHWIIKIASGLESSKLLLDLSHQNEYLTWTVKIAARLGWSKCYAQPWLTRTLFHFHPNLARSGATQYRLVLIDVERRTRSVTIVQGSRRHIFSGLLPGTLYSAHAFAITLPDFTRSVRSASVTQRTRESTTFRNFYLKQFSRHLGNRYLYLCITLIYNVISTCIRAPALTTFTCTLWNHLLE